MNIDKTTGCYENIIFNCSYTFFDSYDVRINDKVVKKLEVCIMLEKT